MTPSLENTIIAYFDHRLSDAESAELLHHISVTPESLRLFQQYENIRSRVRRAQSNVVVYPEMETKLFSNLAMLQAQEDVRLPYFARFAAFRTPALLLLLTLSLAGAYLLLSNNQHNPNSSTIATGTKETVNRASFGIMGIVPRRVQKDLGQQNVHPQNREHSFNSTRVSTQEISQIRPTSQTLESSIEGAPTGIRETPQIVHNHSDEPQRLNRISLVTNRASLDEPSLHTASTNNVPKVVPPDEIVESDKLATVQFGVWGATGSLIEHDLQPFGGVRFSGAYFVTDADMIGLRVASSRVRSFSASTASAPPPVMATGHDDGHYIGQLTEEFYFEHREPIFNGRFLVLGSVAAGLIPNGNEISAEIGIGLPLTKNLTSAITFALTRSHYYSITNIQPSHDNPTSLNALGGRVYYGLAYEF